MRHETAITVLAAVIVVAFALAAYYAWLSAKHRGESERWHKQSVQWQEQSTAKDTALGALLSQGLRTIAPTLQQPHGSEAEFSVPALLARSAFADFLRALGDQYAVDLHQVQQETALKVRNDLENGARESAKAAVHSFSSAMVSTAKGVSDAVSAALHKHADDDVFETLTQIEHGVQQLRHQAQSNVVMSGGLIGQRWASSTLTDVVRAAQGAIPDYTRVNACESERWLMPRMVGPVKLILSHLLDNATRYSPATAKVWVSAEHGHHGVTLLIDDAGKGMSVEELQYAQAVLDGRQDPDILAMPLHPRIGFPVIGRLARRYHLRVVLSTPSRFGGICASLFVPEEHFTAAPDTAQPVFQTTGFQAPAPAGPPVTANGLQKRRSRQPVQPQQSRRDHPTASEHRASVFGAWARTTRDLHGEAAAPQEPAEDAAVRTDQEEGSVDR
ncbi:ATP-binding protein [Streptomyces sp. BK205]|uniref:ATP-binding protein n=1 Tax=Streptomyces sp. BK205 TaxID=2512164 RepID=UPI001043DB49|nr:ATP-binding protein [Streptomyces sp. BK205]TCR22925.1 hypothetical protein EV578_104255 [Streptomyces sp. BK205]